MSPDLRAAVDALRAGEHVCFPTETVWSLSCSALDEDAVGKLRKRKQRPEAVALAVGVHSWRAAAPFIEPTAAADALATRFFPGPLSLVVPRRGEALAHVAPGLDTISIRVPDHPIARDLLDLCGPLVMTSANVHGEVDPRAAADVRAAFPDLVVVDGPDVAGTASTIVDCTGDEPVVLREGLISKPEVAAAWP